MRTTRNMRVEPRCPRCRGFLFTNQTGEQSCIACGWHTPIIPLPDPPEVKYLKLLPVCNNHAEPGSSYCHEHRAYEDIITERWS